MGLYNKVRVFLEHFFLFKTPPKINIKRFQTLKNMPPEHFKRQRSVIALPYLAIVNYYSTTQILIIVTFYVEIRLNREWLIF